MGRPKTKFQKPCKVCGELHWVSMSLLLKGKGMYCSVPCKIIGIGNDSVVTFWDKIAVGNDDECWPWLRATARGYGSLMIYGRKLIASRIAYEMEKGPLPDGAIVRHTCDNPPCCNPAHLVVGSMHDNVMDMIERGRMSQGLKHTRALARGGTVKLSEYDVRLIRYQYSTGRFTQKELANAMGVGKGIIQSIIVGRAWSYLEQGDELPLQNAQPIVEGDIRGDESLA